MLSATSSPHQQRLRSRSTFFVVMASPTPADLNGVVSGSSFGVRAQGGVQSSAVLRPMRQKSTAQKDFRSRSSSCGGLIAITGGMGALGALSAEWVGHGALGTGCQLLLMGRSGRSSQAGALGIMGADGPAVTITLLACDASAAENASCMLSHPAAAGSGEQHARQINASSAAVSHAAAVVQRLVKALLQPCSYHPSFAEFACDCTDP